MDIRALAILLGRLLAPWCNETRGETVGSAVVLILVIIGVLLAGYHVSISPPPPAPVSPTSPTETMPSDPGSGSPQDASTGQPDPAETGMAPALGVPLVLTPGDILLSILPVGCGAAQRTKWQAFGATTATCLMDKCEIGKDLVAGLQGGGWVDLLMSEIPCALGCLASSVGTLVAEPVTVTRRATWHGTAGSEMRREPGFRLRIVPR